jgi:His-Xaa-Ser system radical SAM maturase HxsC
MMPFEHDLATVICQADIEAHQGNTPRRLGVNRGHFESARECVAHEHRFEKAGAHLHESNHSVFDPPRYRGRAKRRHRHDEQPMRQALSKTCLGRISIIVVDWMVVAGHIGETLSDWVEFIDLLKECRRRLPSTAVQVLTNGRAFANSRIVGAWMNIGHPNLMAAIPVYASVDSVHDYVVQAKGAFDETILGILKLKDRGQRVEIRVVLHAVTAPIVAATCRWIARNLPFVDHVALMGLENTGFAIANDALLWIDPVDYREALADAVDHLVSAGVKVSVYNLPKCVLSRSVWSYALQSISGLEKRICRRMRSVR